MIPQNKIKTVDNNSESGKNAFYAMQNLTLYNRGLLDYGVFREDIFTPNDLYENKNIGNGNNLF